MGLHLTGDISAGSLSIVVTLVTIALTLSFRLGTLQQIVTSHTQMLASHSDRLDRYEKSLVMIGGDMQRMIGRIEATQDRLERATGHRPGENGS